VVSGADSVVVMGNPANDRRREGRTIENV